MKLVETLAEADRVTAEPFARWKGALDEKLASRFGCSVSELRPWHYADPFFQETPPDGAVDLDPLFAERDVVALARRTFEGIGLDVDGILGRSDLYPRDGKNQHAFCIDIDRAGDVRVLANTVETHDCADTMLHELGHGVYDLGFSDDLPWLLRSTHLVATEGSALFSGALSGRGEWLEAVLGASPSDVAELGTRLDAARAAELLVFTRWVLVMNAFERALYADPDGELDTIWWELVSRYQGMTPPDGRRAPDWAAKIHIAVAPVYYHTYLYGAIVGLQLTASLEDAAGGIVDRPDAGRDPAREALRSRPVGALGQARRGCVGIAVVGRVARARRREGLGNDRRRSARRGIERGGGGAEDQLHRALLRPRVRLRVHAGHRVDPRGHERAGIPALGARARDGVVGVVGLRVDDQRDRRREQSSRG